MSYTLKMHRVFSAPPERVYRAFVHPDALAKWLAPHGFIAKVEHAEVKPGGSYKTTFTNFSTGTQHHFHGIYVDYGKFEKDGRTDTWIYQQGT